MRIFCLEKGARKQMNSLQQALNIEDADKLIAFVGAGGKSTLIAALAQELCEQGKKVIVTTTTHIRKPQEFLTEADLGCIKEHVRAGRVVIAGNDAGGGKLKSFSAEGLERLYENCDYLLVEADGAREMPIKVPAQHEPVLPHHADLVVAVAGIDALDQKIKACCHRAELVADFLGKSLEDCVDEEDIAAIFQSNQGSRKGVCCRFLAVVNKVNGKREVNRASVISQSMEETMLAVGRVL